MAQQTVVLDATRLNVIQLCARKYFYTFGQAYVPQEKPDFLEKGDLMHQMLKPYYILRKSRTRWFQNKRSHDDVVRSCTNIGRYFSIKMQLPPDEVNEIIYQFTEYCKFYENDGWDRILAVEHPGSIILYEDDDLCIVYELKPDLVIQINDGMVLPVDHKTSQRRQTPSGLANQFMGYCWALGCNNLVVNKIGFQKTLKPQERFQRYTLSYSDDVLQEWRENTIWWVKEYLRWFNDDYWPANFTSCDKWGGCVFQSVCIKERIAREYELKRRFEVSETWDVGRGL